MARKKRKSSLTSEGRLRKRLTKLIQDLLDENPYAPQQTGEYTFSAYYNLQDAALELVTSMPELAEKLLALDVKPGYHCVNDAAWGNVTSPKKMYHLLLADVVIHLVDDNQAIMDKVHDRHEVYQALQNEGAARRRDDQERLRRAEEARIAREKREAEEADAERRRLETAATVATTSTTSVADPPPDPPDDDIPSFLK